MRGKGVKKGGDEELWVGGREAAEVYGGVSKAIFPFFLLQVCYLVLEEHNAYNREGYQQ